MSAEPINPQAVVSPKAKLAKGVQVGAFAVVGADVELGEGCMVHHHAVVQGPAKFGAGNVFHPFCVIGGDPQATPTPESMWNWRLVTRTFSGNT